MLKTMLIAAVVLEVAQLFLQVHSAPLTLQFGNHFTRSAVDKAMNDTRPGASICEFHSMVEVLTNNATLMEILREALLPNRDKGHSISVDYLRVILIEENITQEEWIWSRSLISLYLPPRFAFTGLFNFGWWPNIRDEPKITLCIPHLCSERREYLQERLIQKLQSLAADGREVVSSSHSDYSLKVGSNGTLATSEGLSPAQLSFAQEVFLPIVYLFVVLVVYSRCTVLYSGDVWFYKRKTVKGKMKSIRCCCHIMTKSREPEETPLMPIGTEGESNADNGTSPPEPHASTDDDNAHNKALMRNISTILAFQFLATCLSLCLGREVIIHYIEVYSCTFAESVKAVCFILWIVALLALCAIAVCYTCVQQYHRNHRHLNLCGTYCIMPLCFLICCCEPNADVIDLFSSVVDVVLTIGTIHFLAYVTSVSLLFLLTSFLRNWLPTFYIIVTNVSCFTILLVALSEVTYLFLKVKLDKPSLRSKKWRCLMAASHRAVVFLLFIALSAAMCVIYLQPVVLYNHLSTSPMFTPVVTMAATSLVIYTLIRRYHIIPFNKDARKYITN